MLLMLTSASVSKDFGLFETISYGTVPRINFVGSGSAGEVPCGYFYDIPTGEYLGTNCEKPKDIVIIGHMTSQKIVDRKIVSRVENLQRLPITHTEFQKRAATIYGESTAYISTDLAELSKEMAAIAFVHLHKNDTAYGATSSQAKLFSQKPPKDRIGKMQLANWAIINAGVPNGYDYSFGANAWDGAEQSLFEETEVRASVPLTSINGKTRSIELHMNTMGWNIEEEHYEKWKQNVGSRFKAPRVRVAPDNYPAKGYYNKGKIRLHSTAVYGQTIFWKEK